MTKFQAYAANFDLYPKEGEAFQHLLPLLSTIKRVDFTFLVNDPSVNQGQMISNFDDQLEKELLKIGAESWKLTLPPQIPQEFDFTFIYSKKKVAVEIEKTNREKILRDILKCHMYQYAGADFAIVGLPRNYPHTHGEWDLFRFGMERFSECKTYGFGTADKLGRILLWGYDQYDAVTDKLLTRQTRHLWRSKAAEGARLA